MMGLFNHGSAIIKAIMNTLKERLVFHKIKGRKGDLKFC